MSRVLKPFFVIVLLFCFFQSNAQFSFNENCKQAYQEIFNLRLRLASEKIKKEKELHPDNKIVLYLQSSNDFIETFLLEDISLFQNFKNNTYQRLSVLTKTPSASPYFLFTQAEIYLQLATLKLKFKEYLTAAYDIRKAFKLLEKNSLLFPEFIENKKSLGLLHTLIGAVPDEYKWMADIVGMKGTVNQGMREFDDVINSKTLENPLYSMEAKISKAYVLLNIQKDKIKAHEIALEIQQKNQNGSNLLLSFFSASLFMRTGDNENALKILLSRPAQGYVVFPYMNYITGIAKMNRLDPDANVYFERYLKETRGKNFIKSSYHKLAWVSLFFDDLDGYNKNMKAVSRFGEADMEDDSQALKESKTDILPNVALLKARVLSDGGYYHKAIAQIGSIDHASLNKFKDQLEILYRMGRIYDESGQKNKALEYYSQVIKSGEDKPYYFAANSALNTGFIYEKMNDRKSAVYYYKKCLEMKGHDYKKGIDQKAKQGLIRMQN